MGDVLLDLAARCEAATGPDRELDGDIAVALGFAPVGMSRQERSWLWVEQLANDDFDSWVAPEYSFSVDAALKLIPIDCRFEEIMRDACWDDGQPEREWVASVVQRSEHGHYVKSYDAPGDTLALALCAAALKARALELSGQREAGGGEKVGGDGEAL